MTISLVTSLDTIEVKSDGTLQLRFAKQIVNDAVVVQSQWHRAALAPGDDWPTLKANVDADLATMGYPSVADDDSGKVDAAITTFQTADAIAAYQAAHQPAHTT